MAEAVGVRPAMRLSQAEALCPAALFLPADEPACLAAHRALEESLRHFTDRVETAGPGLLFADVAGLERPFGSDARLARQLAKEAERATGLEVRVGLAGNRFSAEQAACAAGPGGWYVVPPGQEQAFLSPLPLSTLPADAETLRRLHLLGVRTLGTLAALPRPALIRQFSPQAGFLHDLASGRDPRPVHADGLIALSGCRRGEIPRLLMAGEQEQALEAAHGYGRLFGPDRFFVELQRHYHPGDVRLLGRLLTLADRAGLPLVATGNVHYLTADQREVHDLLTCIRTHTTLEDAGDLLRPNDEYRFRSPAEMAVLFEQVPSALENTLRIAERCASAETFLPGDPQVLPRFPVPRGRSASGLLRELCLQALTGRYPTDPPLDLLEHELAVIHRMGLSDYFLVVWDIVHFARSAGIRCQGRGSAANSLVAYLLDITPIDPVAGGLVFERFLSPERCDPPDIDIDFAADRREEVIRYVYRRYGEDHAAMACTLVTFRTRSAVRDVARALGFPPPLVERLAAVLDVGNARSVRESRGLVEAFGPDLAGRPFQHLLRIVPRLDGIPRHLGTHNGGMVLSGPPLCELVPLEHRPGPAEGLAAVEGRVVTQWDKDALEGAGMIKVDLLGLRMLSAIEDAVTIIEAQTGERPDLDRLERDDPAVYDMICHGETVGIFQVESRAQASLIPHFKPRSFADLVVQISLIRPGPLQAQMVHPYLRRRQGLEPATFLHPLLRPALEETLGVIVFQEQVLKAARDLAGFTPGEAELLRRALSHKWKSQP